MSEWQPIETAPKDGTTILVYGNFAMDKPAIGAAYWFRSVAKSSGWITTHVISLPGCHGQIVATHWMPLPFPPGFCEHGIEDGDWCEQCNREYKAARAYEENR